MTEALIIRPQDVPLVQVVGTLEFTLEHVGALDLDPADQPRFEFDLDRVGEPPLRIGRRDITSSPPVNPEVDLLDWLAEDPTHGLTSRIQAVVERRGDHLALRTMSSRVPTYHRRSGMRKARPLTKDEYVDLLDYDTLYFSNPRGPHIRLRIRILHP